jgi:hypothetical protein
MTRWRQGGAEIERMLAGGELDVLTGAAADGEPYRYGGLRRQRNDIEYPLNAAARVAPDDARAAIAVATELTGAAEQLLPHLGLFG